MSAVDVYAERLLAESAAERTVPTDTYALAYALSRTSVDQFEAIADAVHQARVAGAFGKGYCNSVASVAALLVALVQTAEATS